MGGIATPYPLNNPVLGRMLQERQQQAQQAPQPQPEAQPSSTPDAMNAVPQPQTLGRIEHTHDIAGMGEPGGGLAPQPVASQKPLAKVQPIQPNPAELGHQQEYNRLTGVGSDPNQGKSGISQIKNPVGRTLLQIADAVGGGLFPRIAMNLPGTQLHHNMLVRNEKGALDQEQTNRKDTATEELEAAKAEHQINTEDQAAKNEVPHTLQTAEGIKQWNPVTRRFDIDAGQAPTKEEMEGKTVTTDQGIFQWNSKTNSYDKKVGNAPEKEGAEKTLQDADGLWYHIGKDNTATPITINGQPFQGKSAEGKSSIEEQIIGEHLKKVHPNETMAQARAHTQPPPTADRGQNFVDPKTHRMIRVEPGGSVPEGALTPGGENSQNLGTSQTRTMVEAAPKVLDLVNRVGQLVDQQQKTLGPAGSRWSEFMSGKVGAPNPDFTRLRTNVGLLQTALMRMHVGARGGEQMMEHFRDLIDTSKQSSENLKAALDEIKAYAQSIQGEHGAGGGDAGGTQRPTATDANGKKVEWDGKAWIPK